MSPTDLSDAAAAGVFVWVLCRKCGHAALRKPRDIESRAATKYFDKAALKCCCLKCGCKAAAVIPSVRKMPPLPDWPKRKMSRFPS